MPSLTGQGIQFIHSTVVSDRYWISADTLSPGIGIGLDRKKLDRCISKRHLIIHKTVINLKLEREDNI